MKRTRTILTTLILLALSVTITSAQNYSGTQQCQGCHSNQTIGGTQYTKWSNTLHAKIHLAPSDATIRPLTDFINGHSIGMGSSFGNAQVVLSKVGNDFFVRVGAAGTNYRVAWTYGYGYKQRYLVKIDTSYYMMPVQYNFDYMNPIGGTWAAYNAGNWFNSDGSPKATSTNSFRTKSWDKNCVGCHVTAGRVDMVVSGSDTSWKATWAGGSSAINILIGCESCHGPSATHTGGSAGTMNPSNLPTKQAKIEVCGQCHNRASSWRGTGLVGTHEFPKNELLSTYFNPADPTKPLDQFLNLATPPNQSGGPGTWPDLVTARQHHQQYQEMIGAAHYTNPFVEMTCFTCHAPHSSSPNPKLLVDSLTVGPDRFKVSDVDNTLCLSCHATHGPFSSMPKSWVANPVQFNDSIAAVVNQHTRHSVYDPTNLANSGGIGRCSSCHMTKTAVTARPYDISTHTWHVVAPVKTLQYAGQPPANGMLNTCASCHRNPSMSSIIPGFGITDGSLTNWSEATDVALADTLWRYWQAWGWTGVKEIPAVLPTTFSITQNFPNPFNPSTKMFVDLAERGSVRLAIYNLIGEEVARLMDGEYGAGRYEVTWSGRDDFGMPAASGIYIYRLEVGDFSSTKKMMLLR